MSFIDTINQVDVAKQMKFASVNINTSGDNTIIAAPGLGIQTKISHMELQNTSVSNVTIIFKSAATAINGAGFVLQPNDIYYFAVDPTRAELYLTTNNAFVLNLSGSLQVSGFVIYRTDT